MISGRMQRDIYYRDFVLGFRIWCLKKQLVENQMDKKMENEMETGLRQEFRRIVVLRLNNWSRMWENSITPPYDLFKLCA